VPFKAIQANTSRFVDEQYIPSNLVIKEAKNMQKEDVIHLLEHIKARQTEHGPEEAFRFRIYVKKNSEHLSKYPRKGLRQRSRNKGKRKQTTSEEDGSSTRRPGYSAANDEDANSAIDPVILEIDKEMRACRNNNPAILISPGIESAAAKPCPAAGTSNANTGSAAGPSTANIGMSDKSRPRPRPLPKRPRVATMADSPSLQDIGSNNANNKTIGSTLTRSTAASTSSENVIHDDGPVNAKNISIQPRLTRSAAASAIQSAPNTSITAAGTPAENIIHDQGSYDAENITIQARLTRSRAARDKLTNVTGGMRDSTAAGTSSIHPDSTSARSSGKRGKSIQPKVRNSDAIALEEAKSYLPKQGKRRRR